MRKLIGLAALIIGGLFLWTTFGGSVDGEAPTKRPDIDAKDVAEGAGKAADGTRTFFDGLATFIDNLPPAAWGMIALVLIAGVVITLVRRNPFIVIGLLLLAMLGFAAGGAGSR